MKVLTKREQRLVNEAHASGKCFICQENEPTKLLTRGKEKFKICSGCEAEVQNHNRIRKCLYNNDIFRMTLGAPLPPRLTIKSLKD